MAKVNFEGTVHKMFSNVKNSVKITEYKCKCGGEDFLPWPEEKPVLYRCTCCGDVSSKV